MQHCCVILPRSVLSPGLASGITWHNSEIINYIQLRALWHFGRMMIPPTTNRALPFAGMPKRQRWWFIIVVVISIVDITTTRHKRRVTVTVAIQNYRKRLDFAWTRETYAWNNERKIRMEFVLNSALTRSRDALQTSVGRWESIFNV